MTKDSKDYTHYSKKNRFMKHNGTESFCVLCDRTFDGKRGAQSHSSKIHNMTLDGRELNQEIEITQKLVSKEIPPVENMSDDEDYHRTINEMDEKISLNLKIRQLEKMGLKEQAYEIREKNNMFETKTDQTPEKSTDDETKNMLIAIYSNEQDPVRRDKFFNMLKMKYCGMSDDMIKIELMKMASLSS
jgi:hypothetical protein|tara:strand:+ start:123 stop:686 length:564 start_codon:yes stop_codon:yes gene_type:complete